MMWRWWQHLFVGVAGYLLLWTFPKIESTRGVPPDSGCSPIIKNYGCYCPPASRKIPGKCKTLFDEELTDSKNGFPKPVTITQPNLSPHLNPIDMTVASICHIDKYCEITVSPTDPDWRIIDWCITTKSPSLYHLQLLGPPHSPVCCDSTKDKKYTMMCMRIDMNLRLIIKSPLIISLYLKLLPRTAVTFSLSLVLMNSGTSSVIPPEFFDKKNSASGSTQVKLLNVEGLTLDLSQVKKWDELPE